MRVLIVAKTRRGGGACVGGITDAGRSVRLIAADAKINQHAGLEYEIGETWDIESVPDPQLVPPHLENIIVTRAQLQPHRADVTSVIHRFMPPVCGGPELLFDGLLHASPSGALYISQATGVPRRSTMFWTPDQPLVLDYEGKRIRYRYPTRTRDHGQSLTFVGFQKPIEVIPARTLIRVSLAHWWRPKDGADDELRCYAQLSGWFPFPDAEQCPRIGSGAPGDGATHEGRSPRTTGVTDVHVTAIPTPGLDRARVVLKETFGYADFLPVQADVINRTLGRLDSLAVMPTGGGKSLCYQLPALLFDGLTLVVSPLIALMQDQVNQLRQLDVPAAFLNCTLSLRDYVAVTQRVRRRDLKILYAAPETVLRPETLLLLEQGRLDCFAVDEAHCISQWGHDFRPEYRKLQEVRQRFPRAVCLALTATATPRVREDVQQLLDLPDDGVRVASFNRPNLFLGVQPRDDGLAQTMAFLERHQDESGIIYCATRRQVDELSVSLNARGLHALPYHAGLDDETRRNNQNRFIHDDVPIMVATIAFGMGINKSNVRFVVHYHLPKDLESYYQEIGRAGRDGLPADCLLLYSHADASTIRHFINQGATSERSGRQARLHALIHYAESNDCRRVPLLAYFGESYASPCGYCDQCTTVRDPGELIDVTNDARAFLSCVQQTGQVFGLAHIISVLRGSSSPKVRSRWHDRLPTFGVGRQHSTAAWRDLARQFVQLGLLEHDTHFGGLLLTRKGLNALQGTVKTLIPRAPRFASAAPEPASRKHDPELFQRLRQLRRDLADQAGVPPYVIFSDRTLIEMATLRPLDEQQLLAINGVGRTKLAKYGTAFLGVLRAPPNPRGNA